MAKKKVGWTSKAIQDKRDIIEFWINQNKSTRFKGFRLT